MSEAAAHPVWGQDNEAIKDEFRRLQEDRDKYLSWFQKADGDLERLHFAIEQTANEIEDPSVWHGGRVPGMLSNAAAQVRQLVYTNVANTVTDLTARSAPKPHGTVIQGKGRKDECQ